MRYNAPYALKVFENAEEKEFINDRDDLIFFT
jgi:hypothetical protein